VSEDPLKGQRRTLDDVDREVLAVARANPTDGSRMVAALASRQGGQQVNRKRVQRLMREHRLLQPVRSEQRRRRPGFFRVERPDQLWHMDMERHEALLNRAVVKGRRGQRVAAGWHKLGAA